MSAPPDVPPAIGFKLIWSDYEGYAEGSSRLLTHDKKRAALPREHVATFRTEAEARAVQAHLKAASGDDFVSSITPITVKPAKPVPLLDDLPRMQKRLTR